MLGIFSKGYWHLRKTRIHVVAYNLARGITEQYSNWTALDGLDGTVDDTVTNGTYENPPNPVTLNNVTYTPQLIIADGPIYPTRLKRINLVISWPEGAVNRNVTIYTLKADY